MESSNKAIEFWAFQKNLEASAIEKQNYQIQQKMKETEKERAMYIKELERENKKLKTQLQNKQEEIRSLLLKTPSRPYPKETHLNSNILRTPKMTLPKKPLMRHFPRSTTSTKNDSMILIFKKIIFRGKKIVN